MENPVKEIGTVVRTLCQGTPSAQHQALETYFTQDASFTHPFCRTGSFNGSRNLISYVYRWYKILSPRIEISIDSIAFDQHAMLLYVGMHQVFSIWIIPFHRAEVNITTVLQITTSPSVPQDQHVLKPPQHTDARKRYYIASQNDLYQTSEFVKFVLPFLGIGTALVMIWQFIATFLCVLGAISLYPVTWIEENVIGGNKQSSIEEVVGVE